MSTSTTNNVIGAISSAAGAIGGKMSEGFFHLSSDKAKNKASLFSSAGDLAKNGNITGNDVDLLKIFINDKVVESIFEEKKTLIMESELSNEEKAKKLDELILQCKNLREEQATQAESISNKKLLKGSAVSGSFLFIIFGLAFAAKKLRIF